MQTVAVEPSRRRPSRLDGGSRATPRELPELGARPGARFPGEPYRSASGTSPSGCGARGRASVETAAYGRSPAEPARASSTSSRRAARGRARPRRLRRAAGPALPGRDFGFHALALEVRQHSEVHAGGAARRRAATPRPRRASRVRRCSTRSAPWPRSRRATARGLPSLRHQLHPIGVRRRSTCSTWPSAPRRTAGRARRRAPLRVRGRARRVRPRSSTSCSPSALPGPPRRARPAPGGDARLLGLDQGVGRAGRRLDALSGAGAAGRGRPASRRRADPVPRPGRRHRARRRAHDPGHPRQAPGSVDGRLKLTEQGEVIADRYANPQIALRHLEQLDQRRAAGVDARRTTSTRRGPPPGAEVMDELAATARGAYRALVWEDPAFESYFRAATPIEELAGWPSARGRRRAAGAADSQQSALAALRAIPWVFAWSQSRANLPGWYGVGSALAAYRDRARRQRPESPAWRCTSRGRSSPASSTPPR